MPMNKFRQPLDTTLGPEGLKQREFSKPRQIVLGHSIRIDGN